MQAPQLAHQMQNQQRMDDFERRNVQGQINSQPWQPNGVNMMNDGMNVNNNRVGASVFYPYQQFNNQWSDSAANAELHPNSIADSQQQQE